MYIGYYSFPECCLIKNHEENYQINASSPIPIKEINGKVFDGIKMISQDQEKMRSKESVDCLMT